MADKKKAALSLGKKGPAVASKTTMNFYRRQSSFNPKKMIPLILVLVIVAGVFVKFGVLDQLDKKVAAYAQLAEKQSQLAVLNTKLAGYDELYAKYGRYSYGWMTENEVNTVDRMEVLKLIENKIMNAAVVNDFQVSGNVITLNLSGITLEQTSNIVKLLEQDELVSSAAVYSASAEEAEEATIFMSVILSTEKEAE